MRAMLSHVTEMVEPAMADVLAPQQVAVGVQGGISILIHGARVLLEHRGDFVIVKIDLQNAYNAASRSVLLRRFSEHPTLAPLLPLLHATLARADALAVGQERGRLFHRPGDCRHLSTCRLVRSIHCEHNFDSEMHTADTVGVWRIILVIRLVLNYVMLSSLHLLHMVSTHHFHSNSSAMQAFV